MSIRLPVLSEHDFQFRFWEKFDGMEEALELLRGGIIEQIHDSGGNFIGIIKPERVCTPAEQFHRSSMIDSDCCLTEKDSLGNVGALGQAANNRAQNRVEAWPLVYDDCATTICAGRVHRVS